MDFQTFKSQLRKYGYGIAAMNEYFMDGEWHIYVVILNQDNDRAFRARGTQYEYVFNELFQQMERAKFVGDD